MMYINSDIEYVIILLFILICFAFGLKPKETNINTKPLIIDKNFSISIKGIACVFILLGHWGQRNNFDISMPWGISKIVWLTTANIALVWFMFFSGYGLSLKCVENKDIFKVWWNRVKKIYMPLLLTSICATILGLAFNFDLTNPIQLIKSTFGLFDWYVFCILIFYSLFYISLFISNKVNINQTAILTFLLIIYFLIAYRCFGAENAHWYRFPWAFLLGHVIAMNKMNKSKFNFICLVILLLCFFSLKDKLILSCSLLAVLSLGVFSYINRKYEFEGEALIFLGGISYFFYLGHSRIAYKILLQTGFKSIILWILISILISYFLSFVYQYLREKF